MKPSGGERLGELLGAVVRVLDPVVLALVVGGLILLVLGVESARPITAMCWSAVCSRWRGLQETLTRMAPLLLIAAGLIVAFRAGIWNLGGDGQFLLGAVIDRRPRRRCSITDPAALAATLVICMIAAMAGRRDLVAGAGDAEGALRRQRDHHHADDDASSAPASPMCWSSSSSAIPAPPCRRPATLPVDDRLPRLFDTTIHSGLIIARGGGDPRASHDDPHRLRPEAPGGRRQSRAPRSMPGSMSPWLTIATFALSAGLVGLAGAVEILGVWGTVRADWNPAYGLLVVPIVFLARFNGFAVDRLRLLLLGADDRRRERGAARSACRSISCWCWWRSLLIFLALVEYLDFLRRKRRTA